MSRPSDATITRIRRSVRFTEQFPRSLIGPSLRARGGRALTPFLARITGNAAISGADYRWKYAWTEVEIDGDDVSDVADGRSGTTGADYAINLEEINHTSTYAWGVDVTADDYPGGFAPRPVGGGGSDDTHRYDRIVEMVPRVNTATGDIKYTFRAFGGHDGACSAS